MNVLLVSCYELGHQPLAVGSAAAHLLAIEPTPVVSCVDLAIDSLPLDAVRAADLVAISVPMHTAVRIGVQAAARIRALNGACHIVFFGLYATLNGDYLLADAADSVIGGEVEAPLVALAEALGAGSESAIPGVRTRLHHAQPSLDRQRHLVPARHLLPALERYAHLEWGGSRVPVGYVEASRGCAHRCLHCPVTPIYDGAVRVVQRQVIRDDVRALVAMGARHITFGDPDFLNGVRHSLAVARDVHDDHPDLTFDITTRIEHILEHRELLPELRDLGCLFIVSAVESLSDEVLANLVKGHTRDDVNEALRLCRGVGITMRPTLVPFTPWTTDDDIVELLDWVADENLIEHIDPVHYTIRLLVPPGSALLNSAAMQRHLGPLDEATFSYTWQHPDSGLDRLQRELSILVEQSTAGNKSHGEIFDAIDQHVRRAAGRPKRTVLDGAVRADSETSRCAPGYAPPNSPPPRLTEAWFC